MHDVDRGNFNFCTFLFIVYKLLCAQFIQFHYQSGTQSEAKVHRAATLHVQGTRIRGGGPRLMAPLPTLRFDGDKFQ